MTKIELIKINIDAVCKMGSLIPIEDAKKLVDELEHMETVMPIRDPSGWIHIYKNMNGHKAAAIAFLRFRMTLETLKDKDNVEQN